METVINETQVTQPVTSQRTIVHRTVGRQHGPINRLVSPGDIGELIKPFIFLDHFDANPSQGGGFGWHPHSGLATLTVLLSGSSSYEDSSGQSGVLAAGSVEWMRAGRAVWHAGKLLGETRTHGFQLWVALPEALEHADAESRYLSPDQVKRDGPVTVVLGKYGRAESVIEAPSSMNYFNVELEAGQRWRYEPPTGHTVGWVFAHEGRLHVAGEVLASELAVFNESDGSITFEAEGKTSFLLGSAVPHPHELHTGYYSVHTSKKALDIGEAEIERLGNRLRSKGVL